jgi:hypothetical protein
MHGDFWVNGIGLNWWWKGATINVLGGTKSYPLLRHYPTNFNLATAFRKKLLI